VTLRSPLGWKLTEIVPKAPRFALIDSVPGKSGATYLVTATLWGFAKRTAPAAEIVAKGGRFLATVTVTRLRALVTSIEYPLLPGTVNSAVLADALPGPARKPTSSTETRASPLKPRAMPRSPRVDFEPVCIVCLPFGAAPVTTCAKNRTSLLPRFRKNKRTPPAATFGTEVV